MSRRMQHRQAQCRSEVPLGLSCLIHSSARLIHPQASTKFPEFLTTQILWSKNVKDESNCPVQVILPDMDPRTCVHMSLAIFLEQDLQFGDGMSSQWLFCKGTTTNRSDTKAQDAEAKRGKESHARALKRCTDDPCFTRFEHANERLGSHSIRKTAATRCREQGCPEDDLDCRARWSQKRMQDNHVDSQLCWPDVNCAG